MEEHMLYSCGIIFYRKNQILIGHATGQDHWDIPKGKMEDGESFEEAAKRECKEEIGFIIPDNSLVLLGDVSYRKGKHLVLFFYIGSDMPVVEDCVCTSTYKNKYGNVKPEFDKFKYIDLIDMSKYLTERMCKSMYNASIEYKRNSNNDI